MILPECPSIVSLADHRYLHDIVLPLLCAEDLDVNSHECFQIVVGLNKPGGAPVEGPRRKNAQENSTRPNAPFLSCSKRNNPHVFSEFAPVTRFAQSELDLTIEEMGRILDNDERTEIGSQASSQTKDQIDREHPSAAFPDPTTPILPLRILPMIHVTSIPVRRAQIISASLYDPWSSNGLAFSDLWEKGLPLLAKDILPRFKLLNISSTSTAIRAVLLTENKVCSVKKSVTIVTVVAGSVGGYRSVTREI